MVVRTPVSVGPAVSGVQFAMVIIQMALVGLDDNSGCFPPSDLFAVWCRGVDQPMVPGIDLLLALAW